MFGRAISGLQVLQEIEDTPTGARDRPLKDVCILKCGILELQPALTASAGKRSR